MRLGEPHGDIKLNPSFVWWNSCQERSFSSSTFHVSNMRANLLSSEVVMTGTTKLQVYGQYDFDSKIALLNISTQDVVSFQVRGYIA